MSIQRKTYEQVQDTVGQAVGLCATSPQLMPLVNEAQEILWNSGDWPMKNVRYKVRVVADCRGVKFLVWPPEVETVEMVSICGVPITVQGIYSEFMDNGVGQLGGGNNGGLSWGGFFGSGGCSILGDRQEVCMQEDLRENSTLKVYTQRVESSGEIIIMGYDASNIWIRTETTPGSGIWRDGVYLDISNLTGAGVSTSQVFSSVTGVQFTVNPRAGNVYLYAVNSILEERQLGSYTYSTKIPVFRKSILTGLPNRRDDGDDRCTCVIIVAKLRFSPIQNPTDYLQITNEAALKCMLRAIFKRDNGKMGEYQELKAEAISLMNDTLKQYNGYGARKTFNFGPKSLLGTHRNMQ